MHHHRQPEISQPAVTYVVNQYVARLQADTKNIKRDLLSVFVNELGLRFSPDLHIPMYDTGLVQIFERDDDLGSIKSD
jgi:hypothetical protein